MVQDSPGAVRSLAGTALSDADRHAPRVLVSGLVLDEEHAGTTRHATEVLPRVAASLKADGGELVVLAGKAGLASSLSTALAQVTCEAPSHPAWRRARAESAALRRALAEASRGGRPFDLVHTAHLPTPRGLDVPFTWLVHDLRRADMGRAPMRWLASRALRRAARGAAAIMTVSAASAARLRDLTGADAAVVSNGHEHLQARPRKASSSPFLLGVGHIEARKDWGTLVRALAHEPDLPDLVIAGTPKPGEQARLASVIRETGLEHRVRLVGSVPESQLMEYYASCGAVVLPSIYEGFGLAALEAITAGAPLACTDIASHREVAGDCARYFAPGDVRGCAQAIRRTLCMKQEAIDRGLVRAQMFSWDRAAKQVLDIWKACASRPNASDS